MSLEDPAPPPGPRQRRILWLLPLVIIAIVAVIFIGMNLSHLRQSERGEAVGNESGVPGPVNLAS